MTKALSKVKIVPCGANLSKQLDKYRVYGMHNAEEARQGLEDLFLFGVDLKGVKIGKGRMRFETIREHLEEIPDKVIICAYDILLDASLGQRWRILECGFSAFSILTWCATQYPILSPAIKSMEKMRERARAERVLDHLDRWIENEGGEFNGNSRVKACELLLRATHNAFGKATDTKVDNTRPIININLANVFGNKNGTNTEQDVIDCR